MTTIENISDVAFFKEMSEHQISAREFFSCVLLDSLERNFGLKNILISYFNTKGEFLSWTSPSGVLMDSEKHPYREFAANDVVRHKVYQDAIRDRLTYFDVVPRLYKSTEIIDPLDYEHSAYVRFLEENFQANYSVTMAFGINAYIQVSFFRNLEKDNFSDEDMDELEKIYLYVANSYKNFKKHEQAKIISNIQSEIITSGEKAYLVTDDFMHIMSYNSRANLYIKDLLGLSLEEQYSSTSPCSWLPFLLGSEDTDVAENLVKTRVIKDYIFKIYTYDQRYSNGIVDRYHWITISPKEPLKNEDNVKSNLPLTQAEKRVAELMQEGLTYKAISDELVVSYHTVKKHVQNIYLKCDVKSRYQLYKLMEEKEMILEK